MARHRIVLAREEARLVCGSCREPVSAIAFRADPDGRGERVVDFLVHGGPSRLEARRRSWRESKRRARQRSRAA